MSAEEVAIGVVTRTGSAVIVVLYGTAAVPHFHARRDVKLLAASLPSQPYHAAAGLEAAAAEEMISQVERSAEEAAVAVLLAVAASLPAGVAVIGVAVLVKAVSIPARPADVLRSHAWMHAAEGMLYREAVLAAARRCGWAAHAVDQSALPPAEPELEAIGQVAGRPWRKIEKDAARAAMTLLPGTSDHD